ncbi:MAG: AAA family ATPase [Chthoniobacteraceae bacterium]
MPPFIRKVTIRNYKSIAACELQLGPLMFLIGPNGSGKSNFLDCFRFISDSLKTSLDHALRDRGTIKEVRRRSGGHPNHFSLRLDFDLPGGGDGHLSFKIGARKDGGFEVQNEECRVSPTVMENHYYHVQSGRVVKSSANFLPAALPDRLFLVAASGLLEFRPAFDALSSMEIYNLNPKEIQTMQKPDPGDLLRRDGSNIASVLQNLDKNHRLRVDEYLSRIVKGLSSVQTKILGSQETVEFRQAVKGQKYPWTFLASSMSDGTLRALGVLVAIFQNLRDEAAPNLIGLEEPEMALHPAASSILLGALREASANTQILVTSHSPDLLDNEDISPESLLAVDNSDGITRIGPIDPAGRQMLRDRLFTPGELLRQNQIATDPAVFEEITEKTLGLFDFDSK